MNNLIRKKMLKACIRKLPIIAETTRIIIEDMINKKDMIGEYIIRDENELYSLVLYLESNNKFIYY